MIIEGSYVYRIADSDDVTIYIGVTDRVTRRMNQHARDSEWISEAVAVYVVGPFTRTAANQLEQRLIHHYNPRRNKRMAAWWERQYEAARRADRESVAGAA